MTYNLEQDICRLFHLLAEFALSTSETELDYYHQEVNVRVALRIVEQFKIEDLRKLDTWFDLTFFSKKPQKISCKTFYRKTYFA